MAGALRTVGVEEQNVVWVSGDKRGNGGHKVAGALWGEGREDRM